MSVRISPQALRIGMFVHLDGGWLSHPFPLSSFKITDQAQLNTLRSLGLKEVRWDPARSHLPPQAVFTAESPAPTPSPSMATAPAPEAAPEAHLEVVAPTRLTSPEAPALTASDALSPQARAEQQFDEACESLRQVQDLLTRSPQQAREVSQQLVDAVVHKLMAPGDADLRLLGQSQQDQDTAHAMNVGVLSLLLGRHVGLPKTELQELGLGAMLHDVGKVHMAERLRWPHPHASPSERQAYREHVAQGVALGRRISLPAGALLVIAQHHEHADGSGFPAGALLERMTLPARIVALVNRYDRLCNATDPAHRLTPHEALSTLFAHSRKHFDSSLLNAFIRMMGIYPPGSLVQLSDERIAMVTRVNSSRPLKPTVSPLVDDQLAAQSLALETTPGLTIRRSLKPQQLPSSLSEWLVPRMQRMNYFFDITPAPSLAA